MPGANQYKAKDFIDAIPGTGGIVSTIARKVGCDWHTAKKYITEYVTVRQAYQDECEKVLDKAESVIVKDIAENEDVQTAKWYLTMKGDKRGYASKTRHDVSIKNVNLSDLSTDQLERIANGEDVAHVLADTQ